MTDLNQDQAALLDTIKASLKQSAGDKVSYKSEWIGYLPYGQYHWVDVNGKDISAQIKTMDNVQADLAQLVTSGHLIEVERHGGEDGKPEPDDIYIEYRLAEPAFPK